MQKTLLRYGFVRAYINMLADLKPLPESNKDHELLGNYANKRECHVLSDWLLVYRIEGNRLILYRTGTHSDIFNE